MKYCKTCDVKYNTTLHKCLFCDSELIDDKKDELVYNYRPYIKEKKTFRNVYKVLIFINIVSALITMYIDYTLNDKFMWSLIVLSANVYLIFLFTAIYKKMKWSQQTILYIILSSILVLSIGVIIRDYSWAIDYVLPFSIAFNILLLTLLIVINRKNFYDLMINLILMCILGLIPLLLNVLSVTHEKWPSRSTAIYAIITLAAMFILSTKETKEELKRRFHI